MEKGESVPNPLLRQRFSGHVLRVDDRRALKDMLYVELASDKRQVGRPHLRFKDV